MTKLKMLSRFTNDDRGTAAVEFAIVANIFIALLLGIFAVGYVFVVKSDIEESIIEAERYALIYEEDDSTLKDVIRSKLPTYDGNKITLTLTRATSGGVEYVKADISYVIDVGISSIFGPITINTSRVFPS